MDEYALVFFIVCFSGVLALLIALVYGGETIAVDPAATESDDETESRKGFISALRGFTSNVSDVSPWITLLLVACVATPLGIVITLIGINIVRGR